MIKHYLYILFLILNTYSAFGQRSADKFSEFDSTINKWFSAWQLVSENIYRNNKVKHVDFVFFDDKYVYSTSNITIEKGEKIKGCSLMNLTLHWEKALHNDSIILPNKTTIPIGLMSFAGEDNGKPFFIMPLPSFWKQAGVDSEELGFNNLITGIFIHEFSHSQQMQNLGKKISEYEQQNDFGVDFNDDIVQNIFSKDSTYLGCYKKEAELFKASVAKNVLKKHLVVEGLENMKQRHQKYFQGAYKSLKPIDELFLTMEGFGQYSMYLWLINPKGGNLKNEIAIDGVRRGGKWWSQDEGFTLFLILEKLTLPRKWVKVMFGEETENVTELIEQLIL